MDDKTKPNETTEYKYSETEVVVPPGETGGEPQIIEPASTFGTEPEQKKGLSLKKLDWHRLLVPGIIVISILVIYLGFSFYSSRKSSVAEQQKIAVQEQAALRQSTLEVTATPAATSMTAQPTAKLINNEQLNQLQNMVQQKIGNVAEQFAIIQSTISSLNVAVAKTQKDYATINQQVEQLTLVMQQILAEIEKIKNPPKKTKKYVAKRSVAYHVRAIVPGRVWLEAANGKTVTLRVGDRLEGYGEVVSISPRNGMVVMSNGSIIQYGVNDF